MPTPFLPNVCLCHWLQIYLLVHPRHAVSSVGLSRSNTGIVGSNPSRSMEVCPSLTVLSALCR
jgi:hypothetical protein